MSEITQRPDGRDLPWHARSASRLWGWGLAMVATGWVTRSVIGIFVLEGGDGLSTSSEESSGLLALWTLTDALQVVGVVIAAVGVLVAFGKLEQVYDRLDRDPSAPDNGEVSGIPGRDGLDPHAR